MNDSNLCKISELIDEVSSVILGKREIIQLTITAILAGGHVLFEDVPGVGKTLLVKTIAATLQTDYNRIQCTPDLMPSDMLGVSIYDQTSHQFKFHQGPMFTSLLLVDEINRATPKTQSALLEAMAEKKVTVDNHTYDLPKDFMLLATQNPIEFEGTFLLPEAQLDRFLLRLKIGYPNEEDELTLMSGEKKEEANVRKVITVDELTVLKKQVDTVFLHERVARYALALVRATRNHEDVLLGVSPRGSEDFVKAAKAFALTENREYVKPSDFQQLLPVCFAHRIKLKNRRTINDSEMNVILNDIIKSVPVPVGRN